MNTPHARWSDERREFHIEMGDQLDRDTARECEAAPRPSLENVVSDFPLLGNALRSFARGEVWAPALEDRASRIAAVAVFAALGNQHYLHRYAERALDEGISAEDLKEVIYFITFPAGGLRAIEAAETLTRLLHERRAR